MSGPLEEAAPPATDRRGHPLCAGQKLRGGPGISGPGSTTLTLDERSRGRIGPAAGLSGAAGGQSRLGLPQPFYFPGGWSALAEARKWHIQSPSNSSYRHRAEGSAHTFFQCSGSRGKPRDLIFCLGRS